MPKAAAKPPKGVDMYKVIFKTESGYKSIIVADLWTATIIASGMDGIVLNAGVRK